VFQRAFNWKDDGYERYQKMTDPARVQAVFVEGEAVAAARVLGFGQWYGGRRVGMGGFSPVGVAPDHRGRGYGSQVTAAHYEDMRSRGEWLGGLYPASTRLYRGVGFELGGTWNRKQIEARSLQLLPPSPVRPRRATRDDIPAVQATYARHAASVNGWTDRSDLWWDRILVTPFDNRHLYVVDGDGGQGGEIEAYLLYQHTRAPTWWGYSIDVLDLVSDDRDSTLALWRLLGSSSTQAAKISYVSGPEDELMLVHPEQDMRTTDELRWMIRLVDAAEAVAARGYDEHVTAEVHIEVADRHCPWNEGRWRLVVEGGKGRLERGGDGTVQLTVNTLSSIFTGYGDPAALRRAGALRGGGSADDRALAAAFAGPTPWTPDFW
jgi:predicted acetyltransferase